jgi:membrane protease YdiL (CAAX protease family)
LRTNTRRLKEIVNILAYFTGVILLGALLAPPLFWAGQAIAGRGFLIFLAETSFQKFFNRAMLVAAIVLLWPALRTLRVRGWNDLGLRPDTRWWQHATAGLGIGAGSVAAMALTYIAFEVYRWKPRLPWEKTPQLLLTAIVVGILEETLFRGAIFGLFRRTLRPFVALFCVTAIFAMVHFVKPEESVQVTNVGWLSGFALLPHVFHQFTDPMTLLAGFTTIFVLGWVLGYATLRTRSLWMAIGLHAGVVLVKGIFSKFTKRQGEFLPWIGSELQIGLVPVAVLALCGVLVWLWLKYVDHRHRPLDR